MRLSQLFSIYPHLRWGHNPTVEVTGLCSDSRICDKGQVFVAIKGLNFDGHQFLEEACEKGAVALVVENVSGIPKDYQGAVLKVEDSKQALHRLAHCFYGNVAEDMFCVGVTGTNGKTTVAHMVEEVFKGFGWKTGVMGTIDHHLEGHVWTSNLTTSDTLTFYKRLQEFKSLGAQAVVLEVSSHALAQGRLGAFPFDAVVFTNLSRDHLDYHGDMESYFLAKEKLFSEVLAQSTKENRTAIVNYDDRYGSQLRVSESAQLYSFGRGAANKCDFQFQIKSQTLRGSLVEVQTPRGELEFFLPLLGQYNVYNAMAALGVGWAAQVSSDRIIEVLEHLKPVRGRLEPVSNDRSYQVLVDYAHTDDALKNVLSSLEQLKMESGQVGRIVTLFGCGGDRDRGKRALMAQAAFEKSDIVFVTSDNPRTEDPQQIIDDILQGLPEKELDQSIFVEVDRRCCIERALAFLQEKDVLLIAGKGHEEYQVLGHEKIPFSDKQVVIDWLQKGEAACKSQ